MKPLEGRRVLLTGALRSIDQPRRPLLIEVGVELADADIAGPLRDDPRRYWEPCDVLSKEQMPGGTFW